MYQKTNENFCLNPPFCCLDIYGTLYFFIYLCGLDSYPIYLFVRIELQSLKILEEMMISWQLPVRSNEKESRKLTRV